MDEHDKRAREVVSAVLADIDAFKPRAREALRLLVGNVPTPAEVHCLAATLADVHAAAVAAERERCKAIALEYRDGIKPFGSYPEASADADGRRDAADAIADRISDGASPAQAERVSEEQAALHHMDGVFAERHRIAARLRARADEAKRQSVKEHHPVLAAFSDGAAHALRAEADALEVGT